MEEELEPPKYVLVGSLKTDFENGIKRCGKILSQLRKVYPVEDDEDESIEVKQVAELFSRLREMPLDQLPRRILDEFGKETREIFRDLTELEGDVYSKRNDPQRISNLLGSVSNRLDSLLGLLQRWLPFLILKEMPNLDVVAVEKQLNSLKGEQAKALKQLSDSVAVASKRANAAAASIEEKDKVAAAALGDIGVSEHAEKFARIEKDHEDAANHWFWGSIGLILFTAAVAVLLYCLFEIDNTWDSPKNIHKVLFKVAILTTLFYLIAQSVKNFRINKHLAVVNRHRATALRTFRTFVENAGEKEDVRQAILIETTKTIFAPVSTGYVEAEDDGPNSKIIELVRLGRGK